MRRDSFVPEKGGETVGLHTHNEKRKDLRELEMGMTIKALKHTSHLTRPTSTCNAS